MLPTKRPQLVARHQKLGPAGNSARNENGRQPPAGGPGTPEMASQFRKMSQIARMHDGVDDPDGRGR